MVKKMEDRIQIHIDRIADCLFSLIDHYSFVGQLDQVFFMLLLKKQIFPHVGVHIVIHYRTKDLDDIIAQIKHILFALVEYAKIG